MKFAVFCPVPSKKIGISLNLCPGEESLRFRTSVRNLKPISETLSESFLGFVRMYETLKDLPLGTGLVKYLIFLECNYKRCSIEINNNIYMNLKLSKNLLIQLFSMVSLINLVWLEDTFSKIFKISIFRFKRSRFLKLTSLMLGRRNFQPKFLSCMSFLASLSRCAAVFDWREIKQPFDKKYLEEKYISNR
jgi:hypothetical protein